MAADLRHITIGVAAVGNAARLQRRHRGEVRRVSNGDGTLTVKADVANGVRGFWYTLYAADELGGAWSPVAAGAGIAGEPSLQAKVDDAPASPSITLSPTDAKKFYKLVVTDVKP